MQTVRPPEGIQRSFGPGKLVLTAAAATFTESLSSLPPALAGAPDDTVGAAWIERDGTRSWGIGEAVRFEGSCSNLPDSASAQAAAAAVLDRCRAWLKAARTPGLRFFGGLAFDATAPGRFPAAAFWLPLLTIVQARDGVSCTVAVARADGESDEALQERLMAEVERCRSTWGGPAEAEEERGPAEEGPGGSGAGDGSGAGSWKAGRREDEPGARERWEALVARAVADIQAGAFEKVVLSHALKVSFDEAPMVGEAFAALAARAPETSRFLLRPAPGLAFFGASPELLFTQQGERWQADCLAGTAARDADPAKDAALGKALMANTKERHEHQLVVDFVREALGRGAQALSAPETPALRRLANVQHLWTPVSAVHAPEHPLSAAVQALFPTPAVCGTPREEARRWILDGEGVSRGWYAGCVGWVGAESALLAVGIRAASVEGSSVHVHAGAGIVAGSEPAREWEETLRKAAPLLAVLERAE